MVDIIMGLIGLVLGSAIVIVYFKVQEYRERKGKKW